MGDGPRYGGAFEISPTGDQELETHTASIRLNDFEAVPACLVRLARQADAEIIEIVEAFVAQHTRKAG